MKPSRLLIRSRSLHRNESVWEFQVASSMFQLKTSNLKPETMGREIRYCEVCGAVLDEHFFEFCQQCRKYLCFDLTGKENGCAKSHPGRIGYYYCPTCLNDLFLCRNCGIYRTRRGRFPLKDHLCEDCQGKRYALSAMCIARENDGKD
jgi:hypothetical protein